jgi:hypothetical protein
MSQSIVCPNCRFQIEVSDALSARLRDELRAEFDSEARRKEQEFLNREEGLRRRQQELDVSRQAVEQEVSDRVAVERARLLQEAEHKAYDSFSVRIRDLEQQISEGNNKLAEAQATELQLRKERRELEDEKHGLELTVARRLDEERTKLWEDAKQRADEEHRLLAADKDKMVSDLRRQIDDLRRKFELGSQQAQGEVLELELEDLLRRHFPTDIVEPVPRSVRGGDVLQHVLIGDGEICGTILWESKRTKSWNDAWLPKLRDDQREAKAQAAVILTLELPKDVNTFACMDGVWVTGTACFIGLAAALRVGLIEVACTRRSLQGRHSNVELLYHYLSGPEFRQRVEGIVEAFAAMKHDLDSEKRSMRRIWAKRERQLERALVNTATMYGDLGGILGPGLPQIASLDLAAIAADSQISPGLLTHDVMEESPF